MSEVLHAGSKRRALTAEDRAKIHAAALEIRGAFSVPTGCVNPTKKFSVFGVWGGPACNLQAEFGVQGLGVRAKIHAASLEIRGAFCVPTGYQSHPKRTCVSLSSRLESKSEEKQVTGPISTQQPSKSGAPFQGRQGT